MQMEIIHLLSIYHVINWFIVYFDRPKHHIALYVANLCICRNTQKTQLFLLLWILEASSSLLLWKAKHKNLFIAFFFHAIGWVVGQPWADHPSSRWFSTCTSSAGVGAPKNFGLINLSNWCFFSVRVSPEWNKNLQTHPKNYLKLTELFSFNTIKLNYKKTPQTIITFLNTQPDQINKNLKTDTFRHIHSSFSLSPHFYAALLSAFQTSTLDLLVAVPFLFFFLKKMFLWQSKNTPSVTNVSLHHGDHLNRRFAT